MAVSGVAFDQIYLTMPDGRNIIGKALIVNDAIKAEAGTGRINAQFDVTLPREMEVCVVLMMVESIAR